MRIRTRWFLALVVFPTLATFLVHAAYAAPARPTGPDRSIGAIAPMLSIAKYIQGQPVRPGNGKRVSVVEFWATWCPACRQSVPHMNRLFAAYKDHDVDVVALTHEDETKVKEFVAALGNKMQYPVAMDAHNATWTDYALLAGVSTIPHAFVIDKSGRIVWHGLPTDPDCIVAIEGALGNTPSGAAKPVPVKPTANKTAPEKPKPPKSSPATCNMVLPTPTGSLE